jgi:transcriptional regulator of acetoin/glycerol metabolism
MPYVPPTNHIERVSRLITGRVVHPGPEHARLVSSFRRALDDYHLDPGASAGPRVLSAAEVRIIQQDEQLLLGASGLCLPSLHEMMRDAGYCVLLTNADGVTIDYRGDRDHRNEFKRAGLYLGSCWSEQEEGTCGIAAALSDQSPITVHKGDHFRAAFITLTCSAAPIFSADGQLIGVLNASALRSPDERDSQRLVNRLVRQSAALIENAYFLKTYAHCWILLGHRDRHYVEVQPEMLIAIDAHGKVQAANRCARECIAGLSARPDSAASCGIDTLFEVRAERLFGAGTALLALRPVGGGAALHARVRAPAHAVIRSPLQRASPKSVASTAGSVVVAAAKTGKFDGARLQERDCIIATLTRTQWRPALAAMQLGMSRATLYRRIAQFQIVPPHRQSVS